MDKKLLEAEAASKTWEERVKEAEEFKAYLMSLIDEAHRKGLRYYTTEEIEEIWKEERSGGEGFNRVWNY